MWRERSLRQPLSFGLSPNTFNAEVAPIHRQGLFAYLRTSVGQLMNTIIDAQTTAPRQPYTAKPSRTPVAPLQSAAPENTRDEATPPKIIPFEEYRERLITALDEQHGRQWETTGKTLQDNNDGLFSPEE